VHQAGRRDTLLGLRQTLVQTRPQPMQKRINQQSHNFRDVYGLLSRPYPPWSQHASPRSPSIPSLISHGTINGAARGSAHHQPAAAFATSPSNKVKDRYEHASVSFASDRSAALRVVFHASCSLDRQASQPMIGPLPPRLWLAGMPARPPGVHPVANAAQVEIRHQPWRLDNRSYR
jgi:hypothetical protein